MIKLFMLYAILIFAKKAPKMIAELLKLKGEGTGLKGLNIKNKLGEAALVGGTVKKGLTAAEGGIKKGLGAGAGLMKKNAGKVLGSAAKKLTGGETGLKGAIAGAKSIGKGKLGEALGAGRSAFRDRDKLTSKKSLKKVGAAAVQGANDYKNAKDTKGAFKAGVKRIDPTYQTPGGKLEAKLGNLSAKLSSESGLINDKQAANINKRKLLGMPIDDLEAAGHPITSQEIIDHFSKMDGREYSNNEKGWSDIKNGSAFKGMSDEAQLTVKGVFEKTKYDDLSKYQGASENLNALASTLASLNQTMSTFSDKQRDAMTGVTKAMQDLKNATTDEAKNEAKGKLNDAIGTSSDEGIDPTFVESYMTAAQAQQEWTKVINEIKAKEYTMKDSETGKDVEINATNVVIAKERSNAEIASINSNIDAIKNPPKSS